MWTLLKRPFAALTEDCQKVSRTHDIRAFTKTGAYGSASRTQQSAFCAPRACSLAELNFKAPGTMRRTGMTMKHAFILLVLGSLALSATLDVFAQTTTPIVTVTARGGWQIVCRGPACIGIIDYAPRIEPPPNEASIGESQVDLSQEQFCAELRQAKPPGQCGMSNPPVPGDPNWVSNGCGDGSLLARAGAVVAGAGLSGYSGDLNSPFVGVSFFGACRSHDACYGSRSTQGFCDQTFETALQGSCAGAGDNFASCGTLTTRYRTAVSEFGGDAYQNAGMELDCAAWAEDMRENGCEE